MAFKIRRAKNEQCTTEYRPRMDPGNFKGKLEGSREKEGRGEEDEGVEFLCLGTAM